MRFARSVFRPFVMLYAAVGVAALSFGRFVIRKAKIKPLYKHAGKMDAAQKRLCRLLFNPYRISNGIRPTWRLGDMDPMTDIQRCHEIVSRTRLARSGS